MSETDIRSIDRNMDYQIATSDGMDWYPAEYPEFELDGLYWHNPGEVFRRIPKDGFVSPGVDGLSWHTSGVQLRFKTDAPEIRIDVELHQISRMDHMAMVGSMGFDIYIGSGRDKFYAQSSRFKFMEDSYCVPIYQNPENTEMQEFTLNFPLYSGVKKFRIGFTSGAKIAKPTPYPDPRPVVVYGTSIQQGGCASRPGMSHTNQMSRMLERPFINLGFSGNGKGEPEIAQIMASIHDPAMYVLDYDANAGNDGIDATLSPLIDILRAAHPTVPILLVSCLPCKNELKLNPEYSEKTRRFTYSHTEEMRKRREAGDKNIYFLDGTSLYGPDPSECTVDGTHATDLGFYMIANRMGPVIKRILSILS